MTIRKRISSLAMASAFWGVVLVMVALSGCTLSSSSNGVAPSSLTSGPWAEEFLEAYHRVDDPVARLMLEDGNLTSQEIGEAKSRYENCLTQAGFAEVEVEDSGEAGLFLPALENESSEATGERARALVGRCKADTGWDELVSLYSLVRGNPDNVDPYSLMAQCLIRVGLRDDGYSADQYMAEFRAGVFKGYMTEASADAAAFQACNIDPAHAT
ncbi:MAG: hypothetical protein LBH76_03885 [Propionibacteriaceae bacterium]|jgi:hypothetical protein|nr:hypothetical protein [Propionibacteriaceae bacterium]